MLMITYYKPCSWIAAGFKQSKGYWRLRVGKIHIARMCNKRASKMLIKELSPNLVRPYQDMTDEASLTADQLNK